MSKVASAANNMGVDIDQLNAMLATTISVTRQAPETIGTAFKTIFARISDIEAGQDGETTLGEYT
jgi:TP901 family phage tail tape measure protein